MSGIQSVSVTAAQSYATVGTQGQQSLAPFSNLDLTEAQRTQLRSIFSAAKQNGTSPSDVQQQVDSVLTPAQQKTFAADLKAGHGGHHRHSAGSDTSSSADSSSAAEASDAPSSAESTVLDLVTNVKQQSAAANSTLLNTLQTKVLAGAADSNATPAGVEDGSSTNG